MSDLYFPAASMYHLDRRHRRVVDEKALPGSGLQRFHQVLVGALKGRLVVAKGKGRALQECQQ